MKMTLTHNKDEEPIVAKSLDELLKARRGYIFKAPTTEDSIVFIISGGLDSVTSTFRILNELGCKVYPLYIKRGARSEESELESISYYISLFRERFGSEKVKPLEIIAAEVPPQSIKMYIPKERLSHIGHPMRNAILQSYGVEYAVAMSYRDDCEIKTVYCAISPDDTLPHCSIVACRAETLLTCIDAGDWGWQVTSPMLEPTLWGVVHKEDAIRYAMKNNLPLDKTYTCTQQPKVACGICPECHLRLEAFNKAGYKDPVPYENT